MLARRIDVIRWIEVLLGDECRCLVIGRECGSLEGVMLYLCGLEELLECKNYKNAIQVL